MTAMAAGPRRFLLVVGAITVSLLPACAHPPSPSSSNAAAPQPPGVQRQAPAELDSDHDGVPDARDRCPNQPEDRDGFEDDDGCPDPDNDHDRILDAKDQCPNEPESYNGFEDEDGCPDGAGISRPLLNVPREPPPESSATAPAGMVARFDRYRRELQDLDWAGLVKHLGPQSATAPGPGFDPTKAKFFDLVAKALRMTPAERALLVKGGVVSIDDGEHYSMGSAYDAIYARDLPVLVTTDSILHALHRSYDGVLENLEGNLFTDTIASVLGETHARLAAMAKEMGEGAAAPVREGLRDVDLYLTVARNLLAGAAADPDEVAAVKQRGGPPPYVVVPSLFGQDGEARALLAHVGALALAEIPWRGFGRRAIDFSQFRPRGHYAVTVELRRYFRAMMWLGRPDVGFVVGRPGDAGHPATEREVRAAAMLSLALQQAKAARRLAGMSSMIDFLVDASDDGTILEMVGALERADIATTADASDPERLARLGSAIRAGLVDRGRILGQVSEKDGDGPPPLIVQLFGQRFGVDSFVLSKVVFKEISFRGDHPKRMMPAALDVMAALGNDEAVALLKPEIERWGYAANLAAARRIVTEQSQQERDASLYGIWLDALATLHQAPANVVGFPRAMRTEGWRRKQLQAQLASWAELRHDTILYLKQSYSGRACSYPSGYVEPYPAFFTRLAELADATAHHLGAVDLSFAAPKRQQSVEQSRTWQVAFFARFAGHMRTLAQLARKELSAQPFTKEDVKFLKGLLRRRWGCGGPPIYDGWYTELFYGGEPLKRKPTIADVHTDPNSRSVLEVGVGDAKLLVVAVDNRGDKAVYVGPAYSYYEHTAPMGARMTDSEWQARLDGTSDGLAPPERPAWTAAFQAPASLRPLEAPPGGGP